MAATTQSGLEPVLPRVSTRWLASVLVVASFVELAILRVGTRTAIHIPGLERVAGPYRVVAEAGRLAFFVAVVLLGILVPYLARDLSRLGTTHAAAGLIAFMGVAGLGALRLVDNDVLAPAVIAVVAALAAAVLSTQCSQVRVVVGLFVAAFLAAALRDVAQPGLTDEVSAILRSAELLGVLAATASGPLVRRSLALRRMPSGRLAYSAIAVGVVITGAILANASTVHILMLWNFGLTGTLPAAAYGLAVASWMVAVASSVRCGRHHLALALSFFFLGGIGLTSTYQSGLVVAGLGMVGLDAALTETNRLLAKTATTGDQGLRSCDEENHAGAVLDR